MNSPCFPQWVRSFFPALAFLTLLSQSAHALVINLDGSKFKNGGSFTVSQGTLPAATLYKGDLALTVSGTGIFETLLGTSDPVDLYTKLQQNLGTPVADDITSHTALNEPGTLPVTLVKGPALQYFYHFVSSNGQTFVYLRVILKGKFNVKVDENGVVKAKVNALTFSAAKLTYVNGVLKKTVPVPFTSKNTLTIQSGTLTIDSANTHTANAKPDLMVMPNKYLALGNDVYSSSAPGSQSLYATKLKAGHSLTVQFILQNDGPSTDDFKVSLGTLFTGATVSVTDPANNADATTETFTLDPGAIKVLQMKITLASNVAAGLQTVPLMMFRSADSTAKDWASAFIQIP